MTGQFEGQDPVVFVAQSSTEARTDAVGATMLFEVENGFASSVTIRQGGAELLGTRIP